MPRTKRNDKRERLVTAADELIYQKTFHTTTLADIAKVADVPLGNVYYYFKTKEDILQAVIQKRAGIWQALFSQWDQNPEPRARLSALIQYFVDQGETLSQFGCVIGSLCQELGKQGVATGSGAAKLMHDILKWTESQFEALGKGDNSNQLAQHLLASIQGMSLLTVTFKKPEYLAQQSQQLNEWLAEV